MNTFVDASAWIALLNRRDRHHREALASFQELRHQSAYLVTTNWVAYEALAFDVHFAEASRQRGFQLLVPDSTRPGSLKL